MLKVNYRLNIESYWEGVTQFDLEAGAGAYPAYHEMMRRVSSHYELNQTLVTEAFAALSPNNDYVGNLRSLVSLVEGYKLGTPYTVTTYRACADRAMAYLDGSVDFLSTVKGKKITAFRNCIVDPVGCTDFVLDGHMAAVALGQNLTMKQAVFAIAQHKYKNIERPYMCFAKDIAVTPSVVQASLWYSRKRREGTLHTLQVDACRDTHRQLFELSEIPPYPHSIKEGVANVAAATVQAQHVFEF